MRRCALSFGSPTSVGVQSMAGDGERAGDLSVVFSAGDLLFDRVRVRDL